ncbi:MAG: RNA-binding protein [Gammaproteobacteria bacterium]|jgi:ribosome-associated heat shock protein Hsp15|nr:RNA-binding protein [Gammaproteobacteria bacterium]
MIGADAGDDAVRLDKWLWAARLFKTRGLAAQAITGGKVHVNGERVKAARRVRTGDTLEVTRGSEQMKVVVRGLALRRGPASEAAHLYGETDESRVRREREHEAKRLANITVHRPNRRPDKRQRKTLRQLGGKDRS